MNSLNRSPIDYWLPSLGRHISCQFHQELDVPGAFGEWYVDRLYCGSYMLVANTCSLSAVLPNRSSALIEGGSNIFRPYIIKTLSNGERVGICGITTKVKTEQSSFPDPGTTLRLETVAATECAQNLTGLGVNKIVLLTHIGYSNDLNLMATIPNVDVVVGGDSHTLLGNTTSFSAANLLPLGPYATMVGNVCVVQAWEYGKIVGRLDVRFNAAGLVTSCAGVPQIPFGSTGSAYQLLSVPATPTTFLSASLSETLTTSLLARGIFANVSSDQAVVDAIAPYKSALSVAGARVIGSANTSICHNIAQAAKPLCPNRDLSTCLGGGGVCNLVAQGFLFNAPTADVAIQNSGGCRTDIQEGNITFSSIFAILPFANTLVTLNLTGAQIKLVLEDSINFYLNTTIGGGVGSFPFSAGLRYRINNTAPFGSRFSNIEVNRRLKGTWAPINPASYYIVVTNSFIAQGRDGYFTFLQPDVKASYLDLFVEYAQVRT
jgi:5'-nucleotidase / UDP-sugar diphosphatase